MENVETLKGMIGICKDEIDTLNSRIVSLRESLSDLYVDLFYAENGMERGQHFMYGGKEFVSVECDTWGYIMGRHITKSGDVSLVRTSICRADYGKIVPIPMGK